MTKSTVTFFDGPATNGGATLSADFVRITTTVLQLGDNTIEFTGNITGNPHAPYLSVNGKMICGDTAITRYLVRATISVPQSAGSAPTASFLYGGNDILEASQIDQWLQLYTHAFAVGTTTTGANTGVEAATTSVDIPIILNTQLATCSYLVGYNITLADIAMYIALKKLYPEVASGKYSIV